MSINHSDTDVKSSNTSRVNVYRRRFYILGLFSSLSFIQAFVFNTWGPISASALEVFPQWTEAMVALQPNWGFLAYLIAAIPVIWLMDVKGYHMACLLAGSLIAFGSGIRCLTYDETTATILINIGQFLNGVGGIVVWSTVSRISAIWFPPKERATCTGLIYFVNIMGIAASSIMAPAVVDTPEEGARPSNIAKLRLQIYWFMTAEFIFALIVFLSMVIYFPAKPPLPPSLSAATKRVPFVPALRQLSRKFNMWMIALAYSFGTGVFTAWVSVLSINVQILNVDQNEAGQLLFYSTIAGALGALVFGRIVDYVGNHYKTILYIIISISAVLFLWFALLCIGTIQYTTASLYIPVILGGFLNFALQPVFMEYGSELGYPMSEEVTCGFLSSIYSIIGSGFLFLFFIPNISTMWMNWCLLVGMLIPLPLISLIRKTPTRSDVDNQQITA